MNTRFCILTSLLLPSVLCISALTGCGGSSKTEEIYLPVGTARTVTVSLEDPEGREVSYVFSFNVISAQNATIIPAKAEAQATHPCTSEATFPRTTLQVKYPLLVHQQGWGRSFPLLHGHDQCPKRHQGNRKRHMRRIRYLLCRPCRHGPPRNDYEILFTELTAHPSCSFQKPADISAGFSWRKSPP